MRSLVVAHFLTGAVKVVLTFHINVQKPANVCFDHCNVFSFLPFKGDLVMGIVQ